MDKLEALRSFVAVADASSFSHAADRLDLSRARVSQQVAALERELGARLLNRTTRRVSLTADGALYLERARRVLAELAAADETVSRGRERPAGRLRVDVPTAFGRYLLAPALPAFLARHPELAVEVQLNDRVADLVADRIDLALRVGAVSQAGLVSRRVIGMRVVTCAAPAYLARAGVPQSVADLRRFECIGALSATTGRARDWHFGTGRARTRWRPTCRAAFNSPEAAIAAAVAGGGILQTVDMLVADALASGRLTEVLADFSAEGPAMSLVHTPEARNSLKVRVFGDFVIELMRTWRERRTLR